MALPSLTLRNTKGSALTYTEADANFTALQSATHNFSVGSTTATVALNSTLTFTTGTGMTITLNTATNTITFASSGGLTSVVSDTNPSLGGNLNVNGNLITSASNGNIALQPNGVGQVSLTTGQVNLGSGYSAVYLQSTGGQLTIQSGGTYTSAIVMGNAVNANMSFTPNGTGRILLRTDAVEFGDTTTSTDPVYLTTYGQQRMTLNTNQASGPGGSITLNTGTNGGVVITAAGAGNITLTTGTGAVSISGITYPTSKGTNGYLLATDGIGGTSWVSTSTLGIPPTYTLSTATGSVLGGVKIGSGVTAASDGTISVATGLTSLQETVYTQSLAAGTYTPYFSSGTVHVYTLTGNITISALGNTPAAGQSVTLILKQDATGSRTLTSTMKFAGSFKTLSTTANSIDIMSIFYDGTNYYASLSRGYA